MMITKRALSRRTFVRGIGVALGLPLLDAMVPALSAVAKSAANPVMRLGFLYVPNGIILDSWVPTGESTNGKATGVATTSEISATLSSLAPFRDQVVVVTGLANREAEKGTGGGVHSKCQTTWLCGVAAKETEGADIEAGTTVDQFAAAKLGQETPLRSLELGLEPAFLGALCEQGLSCVYQNAISWRTPTMPLPIEHNPRVVFERLFGEGGSPEDRLARMRTDRSILDWVADDIARIQRTLGPSDETTVSDYLEAVRDVERRIQQVERQMETTSLEVGEPPVGVPESDEDHARVMFDLQCLAYQADVTRVATFQIRREQSQAAYPQLGVPEAHHNLSHHQGDPAKIAMNGKINAYHVQLFSYLVERLKATPDGDGSLLDHSIMLYGAGMGDGNIHSPHELPTVLVGGGCGQLKGGRILGCLTDTPMMNLGLSLLDKVGVELEQIGDSSGRVLGL